MVCDELLLSSGYLGFGDMLSRGAHVISPSESMGAQSLLSFPDRQHFGCVVTPAAGGRGT